MKRPSNHVIGAVLAASLLFVLNFIRDIRYTLLNTTWQRVEKRTLYESVTNPGILEAARVATIKSQVNETVEEKFVNEGQPVKKGQALLRLTKTQTEIEFEQKKNNYLNAKSEYNKAQQEAANQRKLYATKSISRSQMDDAVQKAAKTKTTLDILKQEFDLMTDQFESTTVRSPIRGVVLKDMTMLGAEVVIGNDLMVVGDASKFVVRTKVNESDIHKIKRGQNVEIKAEAFPHSILKGVVRNIAMQAERETIPKVEVTIEIIDRAGLELKHNLSVIASILVDDIPNAIGVPAASMVKMKGENGWLWVRNRFNIVRLKKVKLGSTAGEYIVVYTGIKSGDQIGLRRTNQT